MRPYLFIVCLLTCQHALAQVPFSATWPFNGNAGGNSSQPNISASGAGFVGVNLSGVAQFVSGASGQAANIQNWTVSNCNFGEYVAVTVQPLNGQRMTLTNLSFFFERSAAGPQEIRVRSSIDGFGSDIFTSSVSANYQPAAIGLGGAHSDLTGPVTFRIHACNLISQGGTLHLDEIAINGTVTSTPLPVSLLYFRVQAQPGNRVTLSWATTRERDADRFEVQRSRTISEFATIGQVAARGTSDTRQYYNFSDDWPDAGTTYYRLRQVDTDGTAAFSDIVAVVLDDSTPTLTVLPSQAQGIIRVKGRNLTNASFSVISMTGRVVPTVLEWEANGTINLHGVGSAGLYLVKAVVNGTVLTERTLVGL